MWNLPSNNRWIALAVSCWIQVVNSSIYIFSGYSQAIKTSLALDQKSLTTIASFIGIGTALGIIPGFLYTILPPWLLVIAGMAGQGLGFLMIWLTIVRRIHGHGSAIWQLCFYHLLVGISQSAVQTPLVVTSARNFDRNTGSTLGLLKAFQILGGSIFLEAFHAISGSGDQSVLPRMLSWMIPCAIPLAFLAVWSPSTSRATVEPASRGLYCMSGNLTALAAWLLVVSILELFLRFDHVARVIVCSIIAAFLLLLLVIAVITGHKDENRTASTSEQPLLDEEEEEDSIHEDKLYSVAPSAVPRSLTVSQVFSKLDFWLLFSALVFGFGAAGAVSTNLTQLAISLGYSERTGSIYVSLFCVCSCWTRISVGMASDYVLQRFGIPKSAFLVAGMASNSIGTALAAVPVRGALVLATVLGAMSEGVNWGLTAATACDMFGDRSLSVVFNVLYVGNPIGYYILSSRVVGHLYDIEAGQELICHGGHCFRRGFAALSAASACLSWIVTVRPKSVGLKGYHSLYLVVRDLKVPHWRPSKCLVFSRTK